MRCLCSLKGIMKEEDYEYREHDGKCQYKPDKIVGTPKNCTYVPAGIKIFFFKQIFNKIKF